MKHKRELNEELVDVWAEIMGEKIDEYQKQLYYESNPIENAFLKGMVTGIANSMAMLSSLEAGRFQKDYDRILKKFESEESNQKETVEINGFADQDVMLPAT